MNEDLFLRNLIEIITTFKPALFYGQFLDLIGVVFTFIFDVIGIPLTVVGF